MLFHSFEYLLFLWTIYVLFWSLRHKRSARHALLLVASYWFYSRADWRFTGLLALSTFTDFAAGAGIARAGIARATSAGRQAARRGWLFLSLGVNLGLLGLFKYYDFFAEGFGRLFAELGLDVRPELLHLVLPVGISFYTFQTLSYTLDIYRGRMQPVRSLLDFALYVAFFPQLVAGPIVRACDFLPQLELQPELRRERVSSGLFQILRGMLKKLILADVLGTQIVDIAFRDAESLGSLGAPMLIFVTYAYALQLYGDFAGYTDIAIGSARLLGFELGENFRAPYRSRSLEEFWSRWHITMSSWFRDYVYVGLGGSRGSYLRTSFNVLVAWTLVGLWHGAAWTFVIWGAYHGLMLGISRGVRSFLPGGVVPARSRAGRALVAFLGWAFAFNVVAFSMILFRCKDLASFGAALSSLGDWSQPLPVATIPWQVGLIFVLGYVTHLWPESFQPRLEAAWNRVPALAQGVLAAAAIVLLFGLHPPGNAPFIYFQF